MQPRPLLITGGRIVDPSQNIDAIGDLLIAEGKIAWVGSGQMLAGGCDLVQAHGMIVCPGFVDLHCHLRQPGYEMKETMATGTRAAAAGGFTTVCCMPNTDPPLDAAVNVEYVKTIAKKEGVTRVLPIGCITEGRRGEEIAHLGELADAGVIAFSDDGSPVSNPLLMRYALEFSAGSGLPITDHCEDLSLTTDGVMNQGDLATGLGLKGMPAAAEESVVMRDIEIARATGGRLHIAHVSSAGSVGLIRKAKENGIAVTAEVTPHHLTLTEEAVQGLNTNAKVNPPLRTAQDRQALVAALKEGVIDAIATDHAPHTLKDKQCDFQAAAFGISGFETALSSLMGLVHRGEIDLSLLISRLTRGPARIIKANVLATLTPGTPADVVIFDPAKEWKVNPEQFLSKGKNTPLAGQVLKGKVMGTVVGGMLVYRDSSMIMEEVTGG